MSPKTAAQVMRTASIILLALAFILFGAAFPATAEPARLLTDFLAWPLDYEPAAFDRYSRWMFAISGGLSAAFAVMSYLVIAPALEAGDKKTASAALAAVSLWFVMDSAGSIASGIPLNALFNLSFLILYAAPLILLRAR